MKVLVTGAAGFIGSALVRELSSRGVNTVALDGLLGGLYPSEEKAQRWSQISDLPGVSQFRLDLRSDNLAELPADITHVINQAAMPGLGLSWSEFELYSSCNLDAVSRLIEQCKNWDLAKFIQVSTSSVYGREAVGNEQIPTAAISPYGVTKLAAENLALAHWRDSVLPVTILRYFSVYGPGQRPDMAYRKFIANALKGKEIKVFGDGAQSRSNTYIDDCVSATISALSSGRDGEIYNISGSRERSLNEALRIIENIVDRPLQLSYLPEARGDQHRTAGDCSKAQKELGFSHSLSLEEGLENQVRWQQNEKKF